MNVLILSYKFYPDIGGIEVNSEILAKNFLTMGADVRLVTTSAGNTDDPFTFPIIRKPKPSQLIGLVRWADVVFENNPAISLSWPLFFIRRPLVVALNTWIARADGRSTVKDHLKKILLNRAKHVIAVSPAIKNETFQRSVVIGNPCRSMFKRIDTIAKTLDFVFLGRLVSDKGADLAVSLMKVLLDKGSPCSLSVIGEGPEMENLKEQARRSGLSEYVRFTGKMNGTSLVEELNRHKYILVPSRWKEPFGNVALEGMACGCLPVVSDGGGLPDAVGNAGFVFRRNDLGSLAEVVTQNLFDEAITHQMTINAEVHLQDHREDVVAAKYYRLLLDAITKAHGK